MRQRHVIFLLGLPGAGKTSFAQNCFKNSPAHRLIHLNTLRRSQGQIYHPAAEMTVHALASAMIAAHLIDGFDVVVDESLTDYTYAAILVDTARRYGARVEMVIFDKEPAECWKALQASGMPEPDFKRKVREWSHVGHTILGMGEAVFSPISFSRKIFMGAPALEEELNGVSA